MLPILPTRINPIIDLFVNVNNHQAMLGKLDKMDLHFFYIELFFIALTIAVTALVYFINRRKNKKLAKQKAKEGLCMMLILAVFASFTYFTTINPTISKYNKINNLSLETLFSSYHINKIEEIKNTEKTVVYDASGDKKPETQFKVYLKKTFKNKSVGKSIYKYLDNLVVINVSKINKNSFDILLPDGQVVTIKEKDAEQIFNTINKIKAKESEN